MDPIKQFVTDNTAWIMLVMAVCIVTLWIDRADTYLCPQDEIIMDKVDRHHYRCPKCSFVKHVNH